MEDVMRLIITLFLTILAVLATFFFIGGEKVSVFLDIPSFIICVIFPLLFIITIKGFSTFKSSFAIIFNKNISKELLVEAKLFFKMFRKIIFLSCILAVVIAILNFLAFGEGRASIGINAALMLNSIIYLIIINILILPYSTYIEEKLQIK
jgi:hypothetical protein